MANKTTKNDSHGVKLAVLGASIAGAAATAYFFLGPKGKQHQKHAKAWAIKMKGDIVEKLETAREISEPVYHEIIDAVAAKYQKGAKISGQEIKMLADDLKKHWKTLSKAVGSPKRSGAKVSRKAR
jgi:hypothetical protein